MDKRAIGLEYLDALAFAQEARRALETNDGDHYDPIGDTKRRVERDFDAAVDRLARATEALVGPRGPSNG